MELFTIKFKEEAEELIDRMQQSLLLMENNPGDRTLVEEIFRDMHTLKGNSSMFGYKEMADLTHQLESIYDLMRIGDIKISKQILNITFSALDHLSALVNNENSLNDKEKMAHVALSEKVLEIVNNIHNKPQNNELAIPDNKAPLISPGKRLTTYVINFTPDENFFVNGSDPLNLIIELHKFGQCHVVVHTGNIPVLEDYNVESCYTYWDIYLSTRVDLALIRELFLFVKDRCRLEINVAEDNLHLDALTGAEESSDKNSNIEEPKSKISDLAGVEQKTIPVYKKQFISSIRVPSERLDNLMSLVSELMTLQAKLGTLSEQNPQPELIAVTENLEKISTSLRDNAFSMCLVPLEKMVTPFHRLVRDLAAELNKEIVFITEGTETELDKNIIEGLSDPLMHILRNSIDHGIEDPEVRIQSGKPREGKILFKAFCAGANVYIEIQDDGKGIDPGKIRNKAIQKGIIANDDILSDKEIVKLVFLPGFSTAERVSNISGRGVGMVDKNTKGTPQGTKKWL